MKSIERLANKFKQPTPLFYQKLFGLVTFEFPSSSFKTSKFGFSCFIINLTILVCYLTFLLRIELSARASKILDVGVRLIIKSVIFFCICIISTNFIVRKNYFKMLKLFSDFDENYLKLFNQNCDLFQKQSNRIFSCLVFMTLIKIAYYLPYVITRFSIALPFILYPLFFIHLAVEQFGYSVYHLMERLKLLNLTSIQNRCQVNAI